MHITIPTVGESGSLPQNDTPHILRLSNRFEFSQVRKDTSYSENILTTTFHIVFARDKTQVKTLQREEVNIRVGVITIWF